MDRFTNQAQKLHDESTSAVSNTGVHYEYDDQPQPKTAIQRLIVKYKQDPMRNRPVTLRDFMARMQMLPRATMSNDPSHNGFSTPADLNQSQLRLVSGLISSRMQRSSFQSEMDKPVSIVREMLLLCYEAKPRYISFALSGYTASDFFAYIYQDIALRFMEDLTPAQKKLPFGQLVEEIKAWMRVPPPVSMVNTPRRHIRRRIMATLDRSNHQASSLLEDREMPTEVLFLVQKLLERDDDLGYTRGDLRDYREVREDLNWLADHCIRLRYGNDSIKVQDLEMVCCPSMVNNFEATVIQRRRGRPPRDQNKASPCARKSNHATKQASAKTASKAMAAKTTVPAQPLATHQNDDFGLSALKDLV